MESCYVSLSYTDLASGQTETSNTRHFMSRQDYVNRQLGPKAQCKIPLYKYVRETDDAVYTWRIHRGVG